MLQRVMDLAERTGDRVIVVNPESGVAHAILPFDAYEELVDGGTASLCDLNDDLDLSTPPSASPMTDEEIEKAVQHDLEIIKMAEQSEKETGGASVLDVLDDEANEEQYYLEPIE